MTINIRKANLFSALNDEQVEQVLESSHIIKLVDGQALFASGDESKRFFLVLGGQIKLFRLAANGDEKIIDIIQTGNTFAEALMFMNNPIYPVNAEALGPARVMAFDNSCFLQILSKSYETCFRVMGTMSQRLRGLIKEIDELTLQSATTRMCSMLLRHMNETAKQQFKLPAAKGVLAARMSMKPETFSRIFHTLTTKKIIQVKGNEVKVLDPEQLKLMAHTESIIGLEPEEISINPCPGTASKEIE